MRRLLIVLLALALVVPKVGAAENWTYGASEHFEVYTTAGAGAAREALSTFEEAHAFFAFIFRLTPREKARTRLIVFSNDRQFAPYRPNPNVAAFYQSGADRDYIVMGRFDRDSTPIVVHEYAHLFLRHSGGRFPIWLSEGMAEVFSTMEAEGGRIRYGDPQAQHLAFLRSGVTLFDLNRLFAVDHDSPEYNNRNHQGVLYAQSWALVHMLHMDKQYEAKYWDFVTQVGNGVSSADALKAVYGTTPAAVQSDLVGYIARPQFSARATTGNRRVAAVAATTFQTRPADAFEGSLVTANLRANAPDGENDARAAFQTLEQQRPNDLPLLESRAYFELRRDNRAAALPYFARAVAQGTRNAKLLHDYARLDPSKAASLLPKALELDPDNIDLRLDHATLLVTDRNGSQAIVAISVMNGLSREQAFRRFQLLANAHMMVDQVALAREAANGALRNADTERRRADATALIARIDEYEAKALAALRAAPAVSFSDDVVAPPATAAAATPAVPQDTTLTMIGRIMNIVCLPRNGGLVLEVLVDKQTIRLLLAKPETVGVRGLEAGTVDLNCGRQDQPIKVGFVPRNDPAQKTQGDVRVLDYSK